MNETIGIHGLGHALGEQDLPLTALSLRSTPETLLQAGFQRARVTGDLPALALKSATEALADASISAREVDAILWVSALSSGHLHASAQPGPMGEFCYRASWLQDALGCTRATVSGIAQQGCAGMFSALRHACALLLAEPELQHILCVGADAFPASMPREVLYNVVSDAACAVVVSREGRFAWRGYAQTSKGWYWDVAAREAELIAAYFPSAKSTILAALARAGVSPRDIDLVIPTGVSPTSWPILLGLCGIPGERLYQAQERFGHTIAADSFIYLQEALSSGVLRAGMRVLLFSYGFGSSWCALVLEVTR